MEAPVKRFDRTTEDIGNLVLLEHVNVTQPDQRLATLFYVAALGGTRDPFIMVGVDNMWVNFGRTQVHLPTREPQLLRGTVGLVVPDLGALKARLQKIQPFLQNTKFSWKEGEDVVHAICPWGNRFRCHAPGQPFGDIELGLVYVEFDVPPGTAEGIAAFYREVLNAPATAAQRRARVPVGGRQELRFVESGSPLPAYDGHHVAVYIGDFSGPYRWLAERGLITMETSEHEWRFQKIVDPQSGKPLFEIEHEVRSLRHPLYARPLVNRNPALSNTNYAQSNEAFRGNY